MRFRIACLLMTVALLLPLMVSCGAGGGGSYTEYQVVYDDEDIYAYLGAKELSKTVGVALGTKVDLLSSVRFDPETHTKATVFVGDVEAAGELPALDGKHFSVDLTKAGTVIRAEDSLTLFLACKAVSEHWVTEEYGLVSEGELKISKKICKRLSDLSVGAGDMLSVMSQNVRCANDGIGKNVFDRKTRLKQLVADYSPDLLGTQEVTKEWVDIFEEYFGNTYGMVGHSRDGETATSGEWNMILYKKERFDLVESGTFWLTDTPDTLSKTEDALCYRICTWAILKDKVADVEILFCNTHLDHSNDAVRGEQATHLMKFIKQYEGQYPIFLTGDFNTTPGKAPYNTVTTMLADTHKKAANASEVSGTFHGYLKPQNEIDFCFFDDEKADALVYRIQSDDYKGFVSDHYGVIGYYTYK